MTENTNVTGNMEGAAKQTARAWSSTSQDRDLGGKTVGSKLIPSLVEDSLENPLKTLVVMVQVHY